MQSRSAKIGPWLVAIGAFLWSTDSVFRSQVIGHYDATFIVLMNHLLCLVPVVILLWIKRHEFRNLSLKSAASFFFLSAGSSVLAMILFTKAFATAGNYTVPVLIQKTQPFITILAARLFLKERLRPTFFPWAVAAIIGAYLLAFNGLSPFHELQKESLHPMLLAFGAAAIWGIGTVAGRSLTNRHSFQFVTAFRYLAGTVVLAAYVVISQTPAPLMAAFSQDLYPFAMMALGPGFIALWIYYRGLAQTKASIATLCELSYPLGAIVLNWLLLGSALSSMQIIGASLLIIAVTGLSFQQSNSQSP